MSQTAPVLPARTVPVSSREAPPPTWSAIFRRFIRERESRGLSPRTIEQYALRAGEFATWLDARLIVPDRLTSDDVVDFFAEQRQRPVRTLNAKKTRRLAPRTLHAYRRSILALLNYAADRSLIEPGRVKVPQVKVPKDLPKRLRPGDLERLLEACRASSSTNALRDRALLLLAVESALRRAELVALNWQDLEWDTNMGIATVWDGKGRKGRECYFTRRAWDALQEYRHAVPPDSQAEPVFPSDQVGKRVSQKTPGRMTGWGLALIFRRLAARSGVAFSAHALRHTGARVMIEVLPATVVQKALGHSSLLQTMRYTTPDDFEARAAFARAFGGGNGHKRG